MDACVRYKLKIKGDGGRRIDAPKSLCHNAPGT